MTNYLNDQNNTDVNIETKGKIKKEISKAAEYAVSTRDFSIPNWVIYICIVLGLAGLVFGIVQESRIIRWNRIMKASQVRIAELEAEKAQAVLEATKNVATGQIKISEEKLKDIDKKLIDIKKKKEFIQKNADRMTSWELRNAFRGEGYKPVETESKNMPTSVRTKK